jgi:uncharacterized damage-inducible protein DinB
MTAPSSDPLDILLAHDAWATRSLLVLCRRLSHEQFHARFEIGLESPHETLTHIVSVMRRWTDRLDKREVRAPLHKVKGFPHLGGEAIDRSPDELIALLDAAARDLATVARALRDRAELATTVTVDWPGKDGIKRYTFTRGAVLAHICTHGMHHRAQCLNMLRHLNVPGLSDRLPDPSVVDWQADAEIPPVVVPA